MYSMEFQITKHLYILINGGPVKLSIWIEQYSDVSCIKNICCTEEFTWKIRSITFYLDVRCTVVIIPAHIMQDYS
jgi:hypothetical protein